ncbi:hypothetical protein BKA70DRAFT_1310186 [Coprinopsis sp. MPI-PUGE-AT-0042]|nr:hypothetical protein BKA70DRAFT_1310186 [Coprinopsis sp. MPI-PUGE-AT-0042]
MGGDHKCPVCQATFTRPQHVARHMRSHTGDRPYKCQYCGDQFARSDLLSRHVNKCHANEKPLPGATNGRRKGTTSLSRATTSKQACDQCVQSSLPCDGSNPCTKCVQRKYRCTYVKFHRQTAPVGPGHTPATPSAPPTRSSGEHLPSAHHHHPASQHLSSSAVLGLSNVPAVNISLGGAGSVGGLSDLGLGPARFPTSNAYPSTSPADDFYHLPPPNGYSTSSGAGGDVYSHSPAYTTSRIIDDDMYANRPGTASSAGSSSTHGSSVGSVNGQWTRNVYSAAPGGGQERLEPRALHGLTGPGAYGSSSQHHQRQQWAQNVPPPSSHHQHQHSHSGGHSVGHGGGGSYAHAGAPPHGNSFAYYH